MQNKQQHLMISVNYLNPKVLTNYLSQKVLTKHLLRQSNSQGHKSEAGSSLELKYPNKESSRILEWVDHHPRLHPLLSGYREVFKCLVISRKQNTSINTLHNFCYKNWIWLRSTVLNEAPKHIISSLVSSKPSQPPIPHDPKPNWGLVIHRRMKYDSHRNGSSHS